MVELREFLFDRPIYESSELLVDSISTSVNQASYCDLTYEQIAIQATSILNDSAALAKQYSAEHFIQGLHILFAPWAFDLESFLFRGELIVDARVALMRSLVHPYSDVLSQLHLDQPPEPLYMLWHGIGTQVNDVLIPIAIDECPEEKKLLDAAFDTLRTILRLRSWVCQLCALHGLGHIHHVQSVSLIDEFLTTSADNLSPEMVVWVRSCRAHEIA